MDLRANSSFLLAIHHKFRMLDVRQPDSSPTLIFLRNNNKKPNKGQMATPLKLSDQVRSRHPATPLT